MTKKENLKWRLKEQPTTESLRALVQDKLLSPDEAREILFSKESQEDRDVSALEAEIKFLKQLVDNLSKDRTTTIVKEIQTVKPDYSRFEWYQPYWITATTAQATGNHYFNVNALSTAGTVIN